MGETGLSYLLAALRYSLNWANRHAELLFITGLLGAILQQWRQWHMDKKRLAETEPPSPRSPLEDWSYLPQISALVAAWDEAGSIQAHIESFQALRYPHKQLVLVAGGSDGTFELANQLAAPNVIVLKQMPGEGKQCALRNGLKYTNGEIIYLTDADCRMDDESFERVIYPICSKREEAVSGGFMPLIEQRDHPFVQMQWCVDNYRRSRSGDYIQGLIGRNAAVRRDLLAKTGDFSYPARIGTDYVLARKILLIGKRIIYCHNSLIATEFHSVFQSYRRQQTRWLRNILIHGNDFGAHDQVMDALHQVIFGLFFVILTVLSLVFTGLLRRSWLLLIAFAWLSRVRYLWFGKYSLGMHIDPRAYLFAPYYFFLDQWMLVSALFSWLSGKHRFNW